MNAPVPSDAKLNKSHTLCPPRCHCHFAGVVQLCGDVDINDVRFLLGGAFPLPANSCSNQLTRSYLKLSPKSIIFADGIPAQHSDLIVVISLSGTQSEDFDGRLSRNDAFSHKCCLPAVESNSKLNLRNIGHDPCESLTTVNAHVMNTKRQRAANVSS